MSTLLQDLRYAVRMLAKSPGFTTAAVLTIALGIGANTAIFSMVYGVLLRPLPFDDPGRLVAIWESKPEAGQPRQRVSPPAFLDWRAQNQTFEEMSAFVGWTKVYADSESPEQLHGMAVSADFLPMLRVSALHGRTFAADEEKWGSDKIVVLDHGLWQRLFGGDPGIIGKRITLSDERFEVIGVLPASFRFVEHADIWLPLSFPPDSLGPGARGARYLRVLARLRPDVTTAEANVRMNALARRLGERYPNNAGWGVALNTLHDEITGGHRTPLLVLLVAVGLVLLIACGNVANLLLSRAAARGHEIAVRAALGASRGRVTRQFLIEGLTLAFCGAIVGLGVASWTLNPLLRLAPVNIPRIDAIGLNFPVLAFALGLSVLATAFFGVVPARHLAAADSNALLKRRAGGSFQGGRRAGMRSLFVVAQLALSFILLVGAGLLLRSFIRLQHIDPGFNPNRSMALSFNLPEKRYPSHRQRAGFSRQLLEGVRSIPGVEHAGIGVSLPLGGSKMSFGFFLGDTPSAVEENQYAQYNAVSPDYFGALGVPIVRGRDFTQRDEESGRQVAIVSQTLARRCWPGETPLGKRIRTISQNGITVREIVGVVGDVRHSALSERPEPELYVPYAQDPWPFLTLVMRGDADGQFLLQSARRHVWMTDKTIPVAALESMDHRIDASIAANRFQMQLLGSFAALALLLATVGLLAVVGYMASRRTREIGIRKALGAQSRDVIRMVVGEGLFLSAIGLAVGLLGVVGLTRWLASLLFEVSPTDPATLVTTCVLMLAVSFVASYIPARRAARIDPMEALRFE
jgi:putative ABC transport system permease protein